MKPLYEYRGCVYRTRSRLLHRFNLHHTRSNIMEDGATLTKCDWCGLSGSTKPMHLIVKDMEKALANMRDPW
jgi:hypothetical protein